LWLNARFANIFLAAGCLPDNIAPLSEISIATDDYMKRGGSSGKSRGKNWAKMTFIIIAHLLPKPVGIL